jgi:hypothetical protein
MTYEMPDDIHHLRYDMTYDTPTTRPHTLKTIAHETDREKRTVQRWYEKACTVHDTKLGEVMDGTRYFSDAERDMLLTYMGERTKEAEEAPTVTVETGKSQMVLATPQLPQHITLESLRIAEPVQFEDPLGIASQFLTIADQVTTAMQQDLARQEATLNQTRQAKEAIARKAAQLHLEQRLYQERAHHIATTQSQETTELQQALSALQQMGKPVEG